MIRLDTDAKVKRLYTDDGKKIKRLLTDDGTILYKSEQPLVLNVSVINGYAVNTETLNWAYKEYTVPKGITEIVLTAVNLSTPYGSAHGRIYLNGVKKAEEKNTYYVGDTPGFSVTPANVPQTWAVKEGDIVKIEVGGWSNANLSNQQTTYLDVYMTIS